MQDKYAQMQRFFTACDELISGKYILADNKISEVLKAIAASEELTGLFTAVTERFDYPAAKQAYLKYPAETGGTRELHTFPQSGAISSRSSSVCSSISIRASCGSTTFCASSSTKTAAIRQVIRSLSNA